MTDISVKVVLLFMIVKSVDGACTNLPPTVETTETSPAGTFLLNANKEVADDVRFELSLNMLDHQHRDFQTFFNLTVADDNTSFTLTTTKPLDLEYFQYEYQQSLISSVLVFYCGENPGINVFLAIRPVNEHQPIFERSPFHLEIREDVAIGEQVLNLGHNVTDLDVVQVSNFYFYVNPYNIRGLGAEKYFQFQAVSSGIIARTNEILDYDTLEHKQLQLNISVVDGNRDKNDSLSSIGYVNITVINVDDQPPYFIQEDCPRPCIAPPFVADVTETYKGPIIMTPPLNVTDPDGLGAGLTYTIKSGNERGMFTINRQTGQITQQVSVIENGFEGAEMRLVIQVAKDVPEDLAAIAILTVGIEGRVSNHTSPPRDSAATEMSSELLIPVVVLGILAALILIAFIVLVVLYRRKQKQLTIVPDDKSEPQTEEEELASEVGGYSRFDSNQKLVFGNKTTLGIGTTDFPETYGITGNALPPLPLRDSATEPMDETKKKKSRRRNKNKEPEIFDGTQEYNMGLENEFYEDPDKAKVKRSTRSYDKKIDPATWIKVPNDQPGDDSAK